MKLSIIGFSGEQPRVLPNMLPDAGAREAWDVRLDDGGLTPTRKPVVAAAVTPGHRTIYRHAGTWLSRAGDVHFAPGPVAQDRLYYTGDGAPKMMVGGTVYPLAVPQPAGALTATLGGAGTGDVATRLYAYTWVTDFGEESEPSPASNSVDWRAGQTVTLSGFAAPPAGRGVTKQRIYRTQTGKVGTYLYLIAERGATNANFVDVVPVDALQEALPSADWTAPPASLKGLIGMPNGMMAAFDGRDVYFCEPWRPHAWPEKYVLTTDWPVVGLAAIGSTMLIMTEGSPYVAAGNHPAEMIMKRLELDLPCINARGIVNLGFAVCYPSHDGLVSMSASGGAQIVTGNLFSKERWLSFSPQTAVAGRLGGRYVLFYDRTIDGVRDAGGFAIDLAGQAFLVRHSVVAAAVWYELATSRLFYVPPGSGEVLELQPVEGAPNTLTWSSKEFLLPIPHNFGVLRIDSYAGLSASDQSAIAAERQQVLAAMAADTTDWGGPVNGSEVNAQPVNGDAYTARLNATMGPDFEAMIKADGEVVSTTRRLDEAIRLPPGFTARTWEVSIRTNVSIKQITMATTMADLRA